MVYDDNVYPQRPMHATNSGGRTPSSKLPASPPPLPRPDGGGQTLALCLCTGPYQLTLSKLDDTCSTRTTGTSTIRRVLQLPISMVSQTGWTMETASASRQGSEPARPQQGHRSPCTATTRMGHGELSLRHEREVDDLRRTATAESPVSPKIPALHMPL